MLHFICLFKHDVAKDATSSKIFHTHPNKKKLTSIRIVIFPESLKDFFTPIVLPPYVKREKKFLWQEENFVHRFSIKVLRDLTVNLASNLKNPSNLASFASVSPLRRWYPLLHPGEGEFVYESYTALSTSSGSIEGSFTFVPERLADPKGSPFEAQVARFSLQKPGEGFAYPSLHKILIFLFEFRLIFIVLVGEKVNADDHCLSNLFPSGIICFKLSTTVTSLRFHSKATYTSSLPLSLSLSLISYATEHTYNQQKAFSPNRGLFHGKHSSAAKLHRVKDKATPSVVVCSQCKSSRVNSVDFFNGEFKAGDSCWLCGGKKEMLCGNCNGAGFVGGFISTGEQ
ncbi:hypothetical protein PTKIN_Ptkin12aG0027700 [Pterospermum kingtungense]